MNFTTVKKNSRLLVLVAAALLAIGLAGCGFEHRTNLVNVSQDNLSNGGEEYFNAGAITYQVQLSRQLNPFSTEDVQYLAGVRGAQNLPADEMWFGVFLWAKNQSGHIAKTSDTFKILASDGQVYSATPLNSSVNAYAWTQQSLGANDVEPNQDSTAAYGPTQGGEVLFKLNQSIYSNRPLTLEVFAPGATTPTSQISLDL